MQDTKNLQHERKRQNDNEKRNATDQPDSTERQSENSNEVDENNMGVHVGSGGGERNQPFVLKSSFKKESFNTLLDSGSPTITFTQADLRRLLKVNVIVARPMTKNNQDIDHNSKPLNLLGFTAVDVQVGKRRFKNAGIVITR